MAALPYIQLYVADYLADTMHLSTEEHGAYLLLIFNYWQTGKPIPKSRLARIARLPNERWISVEASLNEFFNDNGTEWVHHRIEKDLDAIHATQSQRSAAGKASAEARKRKNSTESQRKSNDRSTTVDDSLQQNSTNKDTDTDTDTDKDQKHNVDAERQPGDDESGKSRSGNGTPPCPVQDIVEIFHKALPELPAVVMINDTRRKHLQARWRENPVHQDKQFWVDYFLSVKESRFLMGNVPGRDGNKPFRATFDWLIAPTNFVKVIEGNYHHA